MIQCPGFLNGKMTLAVFGLSFLKGTPQDGGGPVVFLGPKRGTANTPTAPETRLGTVIFFLPQINHKNAGYRPEKARPVLVAPFRQARSSRDDAPALPAVAAAARPPRPAPLEESSTWSFRKSSFACRGKSLGWVVLKACGCRWL